MSARIKRPGRGGGLAFWLTLALIGVLMYLLNAHTPLMMDDYDYSFSWATGERLAGVGDILASQAVHYRIWGGRSVTHFLAQLFLYLGKPVFNLANAAMYVLLLVEICALAGRWSWKLLLAAHALLFLTVPFFGVVFLWLDGACNYLWGTVLALAPLLAAFSERRGGVLDTAALHAWGTLPLFFLAGWTNENTACGVLAVLALLLGWDAFSGRRIRLWRVAALLAHGAGVALMLFAPGNSMRAAEVATRGLIAEMAYRFAVTSYCLIRYAGVGLALLAVFLLYGLKKRKKADIERLLIPGCCAALSAYALVGSPQISDRSFTAVIVLVIAALLPLLQDSRVLDGRRGTLLSAALAVVLMGAGANALSHVKTHEAAWLTQTAAIEAAAHAGLEAVVIDAVPSSCAYTMSIAVEQDPGLWPNTSLEKYYGVRVIGR